jgi:hypothetical protein
MTNHRLQFAPVNVLVAGMHRSGTSAIGQVLARAGLSAGAPGRESDPQFDNPAGFAERRDIVDLDEELLRTLGWTWDAPAARPLANTPDRPRLLQRGRKLVKDVLAGPDPWFIKDPRLCLLLPWWRRILVDRFVAIVPWRPFVEISWSLHLRDELPLALGVALAAAYHRHLAGGLQGLPIITVDYPALCERPDQIVPALLDALRETGVRGEFHVEEATAAIDPALRRATQPPGVSIESLVSSETQALIDVWPRGTVQIVRRFSVEPNDGAPWEEAILDLRRNLNTARQENGVLQRRIQELEAAVRRVPKPDDQSGAL